MVANRLQIARIMIPVSMNSSCKGGKELVSCTMCQADYASCKAPPNKHMLLNSDTKHAELSMMFAMHMDMSFTAALWEITAKCKDVHGKGDIS